MVIDAGQPDQRRARGGERARAAAAELRLAGLSRRDAAAALAVCLGVRRNEAKRLVDEATAPEARDGSRRGRRCSAAAGAVARQPEALRRPEVDLALSTGRRLKGGAQVDLLAELRTRTLIFDGAMGTQLIAAGYRPIEAPESWNTSAPDVVAGIHRAYLAAGADIIETNTLRRQPQPSSPPTTPPSASSN